MSNLQKVVKSSAPSRLYHATTSCYEFRAPTSASTRPSKLWKFWETTLTSMPRNAETPAQSSSPKWLHWQVLQQPRASFAS